MKKEMRVFYLLPEDIPDEINVSAGIIPQWQAQEKLSDEALMFISAAEAQGNVVSIEGLIEGLNWEEISDMNLFFMTDKY